MAAKLAARPAQLVRREAQVPAGREPSDVPSSVFIASCCLTLMSLTLVDQSHPHFSLLAHHSLLDLDVIIII